MIIDRPNPLRQRLARGPVFGAALFAWSANVVDVAGAAGLDFVRLDTEHAWRRDELLEHMVRAAWLAGTTPMIRVDRDDPLLVRKALEIGAGAVLVSDIRTAEEAAVVARAAKFPPAGTRGYSGNNFAGGWAMQKPAEWIAWSNSQPLVGVMVEHPDAVAVVDDIVATPGLDFVYFGPGDYSVAIGLPGPTRSDPRVEAAMGRTIKAARAAGLHAVANGGGDGSEAARMIALGADIIELGNDISALGSAWKTARQRAGTAGPSA
jgi:4-hydroxy-2-oxoheptanedioate aldolase